MSEKIRKIDLKDKKYARLSLRTVAYLIDIFFGLIPVLLYINVWLSQKDLDTFLNLMILFIPFSIVLCLIFHAYIILSTSSYGKTIGQSFCGLAVTDVYGNYISDKRSFFRATVGTFVAASIFGLGFLWVKIDKNKQGWNDKVADTYVHVEKNNVRKGVFSLLMLFAINYFLFISAIKTLDSNTTIKDELRGKMEVMDILFVPPSDF